MIGKDSRYAKSILYRTGSDQLLGNRPRIETTPRFDDRFHAVKDGDRIDRIAFDYLGNAALWWVICDYNDVFYPLELEIGSVLRIPSLEFVHMRLLG